MNYKKDFFIVLYWDIDYENGHTELMAKSIGLNKNINIVKPVYTLSIFYKGSHIWKIKNNTNVLVGQFFMQSRTLLIKRIFHET